jgi:hypothetical protein
VRARAWLAVLAATGACASAPEPRPVRASILEPQVGMPPFKPYGLRLIYDLDFAHAWESGRSHDELVARTVDVLRRRVDGLFKGGVVRAAGNGVEVLLPQGDPAPLEAYRRIVGLPGRFQVRLVDDGSAFMTALARRVGHQPPAGVDVRPEAWSVPQGGPQHEDVFLSARSPRDLVDALASFVATNPLPSDREILVERSDSEELGTRWRTYLVSKQGGIDNRDIADAEIGSAWDGRPEVQIDLTPDGRRRFGEMTAAAVGRKIAIVVDGNVESAPVVIEPIRNGRLHLWRARDMYRDHAVFRQELADLAAALRSGPLPAPLSLAKTEILPARSSAAGGGDQPARHLAGAGVLAATTGFLAALPFSSNDAVIPPAELPPTVMSNLPGSTTKSLVVFQKPSASWPSVKLTVFVSPGFSVTRSNPFSSLTGRVTELTTSRRYSCTTSSPARPPVLVTSTLTDCASPSSLVGAAATFRLL